MGKASETFRQRLSEAVAERGGKSALSRNAGFARLSIDRWIAGETVPTLDDAEALANAVGLDFPEMIGKEPLPRAWREIIGRVGRIDESQVPAIVAGIQGILASLKLDEADRVAQDAKKLPRPPKR